MDLAFLTSISREIVKTAHVVQLADSAAHFGLFIISVIKAEDFAKGWFALFCFVLELCCYTAFPPPLAQGSPCGNHLNRLALLISRLLPTVAADLMLNRKHSHLCTLSETRQKRQYRKIQISDGLGLSTLLEGGEEGGTGLTCKG